MSNQTAEWMCLLLEKKNDAKLEFICTMINS